MRPHAAAAGLILRDRVKSNQITMLCAFQPNLRLTVSSSQGLALPRQAMVAHKDDDRLLRRQEFLNGVNAVETDKKRLLAALQTSSCDPTWERQLTNAVNALQDLSAAYFQQPKIVPRSVIRVGGNATDRPAGRSSIPVRPAH